MVGSLATNVKKTMVHRTNGHKLDSRNDSFFEEHSGESMNDHVVYENDNTFVAYYAANTALNSVCWLCGGRASYFLVDRFFCFSCTQTVFFLHILPLINNLERHHKSVAFMERINQLLNKPMAQCAPQPSPPDIASKNVIAFGGGGGGVINDTRERVSECALHPQGSSRVIRSPKQFSQDTFPVGFSQSYFSVKTALQSTMVACKNKNHKAKTGNTFYSGNGFWSCPSCSLFNMATNSVCTACQTPYVISVTCHHCGELCFFRQKNPSMCTATGTPHILWSCAACTFINSVDADSCCVCRTTVVWACRKCTIEQQSQRSAEGFRICVYCAWVHTPTEVMALRVERTIQRCDAETTSGEAFGTSDAEMINEMERNDAICEAEGFLLWRLRLLGVQKVNKQKTDGNCLFRSISNQLFCDPGKHMFVRNLVVDYMQYHADSYKMLFNGDKEWDKYISDMRQNGVWGDELCLNAAARCFCVNIHVITSDKSRWHLVFFHDVLGASLRKRCGGKTLAAAEVSAPALSLFLAYLVPLHYDDITPFFLSDAHEVSTRITQGFCGFLDELMAKRRGK